MIMMNRSYATFIWLFFLSIMPQTIKAANNTNNPAPIKSTAAKNPEPIKLTSEVLKFIDGKKFGIDGDALVILVRVRIDLRKRLLGAGLAEDEHKCCFYNDIYCTIKDMAILEQKLREGSLLSGEIYIAMGASLSAAKRALLEEIAIPLLDKLRRGKKHTVLLIQESCEKHNRTNSVLLEWAKTDDEHEIEVFMNKLDSFKTLGLFCLDIIHLIGDIIHSCPIAYQQFEEMKQNYQDALTDQAKLN
jgi:hypothetical protein